MSRSTLTISILQDARVVVAGGDGFASAEIFNPPYLFQGRRPSIGSYPSSIGYNQKFKIKVKLPTDAIKIEIVSVLRLTSVTHSFDQNQRYVPLKFEVLPLSDDVNSVILVVGSPSGPTIAPPGAYLLYVVSNRGVPSVGQYVFID